MSDRKLAVDPVPMEPARVEQAVPVTAAPPEAGSRQGLRLWPGLILVAILWAARIAVSIGEFSPGKFFLCLTVIPFFVVVGLLLWTLFGSRLKWSDRLIMAGSFVAVTPATMLIAGADFPVIAIVLYAVPPMVSLWVGWLLISGWLSWPIRRAGVLLIFVGTGALCSMIRVEGMDGEFKPKFAWRWNPTAEQQLLTELEQRQRTDMKSSSVKPSPSKPAATPAENSLIEQPGDWPEFRGPLRDGRLAGIKIKTDWDKSPPKELWRHRIGPGWSSVTVVADRVFTQEQRGDQEFVVCYDTATGAEVWSHHDKTRFTETVAGPGPRATPTFHAGQLYTLGANGALNCLNATTGERIWTRDLMADTEAKVPTWGFSSSPLVTQGLVIVFSGAPKEKSVNAYRADTGAVAWNAGLGSLSYCSPQLSTLDGVDQVLITTDAGLSSFEPTTGRVLWHHDWMAEGIARVVQPALIDGHDLLVGTGMGVGTRRLSVHRDGDRWDVKEQWTSREIKPYYNDLVLVGDHLYGFDGNIFMCVSLKDGSRKWRARGYGNGQVLLLVDQSLLLILTEQGEAALVKAQPDQHEELSRFKAIDGKTWNHPVVSHGMLFVRNGEEIACFQLDLLDD